jgi:hypothetical protein
MPGQRAEKRKYRDLSMENDRIGELWRVIEAVARRRLGVNQA